MKFPIKEIIIFLVLAFVIFLGLSVFWTILSIRWFNIYVIKNIMQDLYTGDTGKGFPLVLVRCDHDLNQYFATATVCRSTNAQNSDG